MKNNEKKNTVYNLENGRVRLVFHKPVKADKEALIFFGHRRGIKLLVKGGKLLGVEGDKVAIASCLQDKARSDFLAAAE
jgi:hypothetical protein